ncbi:MAG: RHS repeat-associated core domain-containing protein [Phycisphaerales bacterium]|nr:RHS repeat-associated core domain-containing protein [Phycisphaerales bacterium]
MQEDIDNHPNNEDPDGVNSRAQEVWGLRYIDDAMVRLLDKNLDGDSRDSGELFWQLSDAQFSTVAVIDKNAVLQERVSYTSYGVGTHRWPHEVNNTGGVTTSGTTSDYGVISGLAGVNDGAGTPINDTTYNVAADLNRDGVIDSGDTSLFTSMGGAKSALASGLISDPNGPDNPFGYDGYVYNPDQGLYTVRFRWYNATFGRWLERDPAGYRGGMNLFQNVKDDPVSRIDAYGLIDDSEVRPVRGVHWDQDKQRWRPNRYPEPIFKSTVYFADDSTTCAHATSELDRILKKMINMISAMGTRGCFGSRAPTVLPIASISEDSARGALFGEMCEHVTEGQLASRGPSCKAFAGPGAGALGGIVIDAAYNGREWIRERDGWGAGGSLLRNAGGAYCLIGGSIGGPIGVGLGLIIGIGSDWAAGELVKLVESHYAKVADESMRAHCGHLLNSFSDYTTAATQAAAEQSFSCKRCSRSCSASR